jgi:hypothetical protein
LRGCRESLRCGDLERRRDGRHYFASRSQRGGRDDRRAARIEALEASVPKQELDGLVASGSAMTPAAVLAMIS